MKTHSWSLQVRLCVLAGVLLGATCILGDRYAVRYTRTLLDLRLREKATFINNFHSDAIAESLLTKDDVRLLQVVNLLENDQEITSVIVVDDHSEIRYHADSEKVGSALQDPLIKKVFETGEGLLTASRNAGGPSLLLASPLKVQGKPRPIGVVRIEMTYQYIEKQIQKTHVNFIAVFLGSLSFCLGFMWAYTRKWVSGPLEILQSGIRRVNPVLLEAPLTETGDEFGQVNAAINELLLRVKTEWQNQQATLVTKADQELALIDHLTRSFLPRSRLIYADRNNRILSDSGNGAGIDAPSGSHLLDLITDANFATLVATAFQKVGEVVRGPVLFQDQRYEAMVLCIPDSQSKAVKTIIALQTQTGKGAS